MEANATQTMKQSSSTVSSNQAGVEERSHCSGNSSCLLHWTSERALTSGSVWFRAEAFPLWWAGTEASHLLLREEEVDPLRYGLASLGWEQSFFFGDVQHRFGHLVQSCFIRVQAPCYIGITCTELDMSVLKREKRHKEIDQVSWHELALSEATWGRAPGHNFTCINHSSKSLLSESQQHYLETQWSRPSADAPGPPYRCLLDFAQSARNLVLRHWLLLPRYYYRDNSRVRKLENLISIINNRVTVGHIIEPMSVIIYEQGR